MLCISDSRVHSLTNHTVLGSISGSANSAYEQYSNGIPNCTVSYWQMGLNVALQLSDRSPRSHATEKLIVSLTVRTIPKLSLSDQLLTTLSQQSVCEKSNTCLGVPKSQNSSFPQILLELSIIVKFPFIISLLLVHGPKY